MNIREKVKRTPLGNKEVNTLYSKVNIKRHKLVQKQDSHFARRSCKNISANIVEQNVQRLQPSAPKPSSEDYEQRKEMLQRQQHLKSFREFLYGAVIYMDQTFLNAGPTAAKTNHLKTLFSSINAKFVCFFNDQVDLIISRRKYDKNIEYPDTDIFSKVNGTTLRVWNYQKCINVLNFIGVDVTAGLRPKNRANLSSLLQNERTHKGHTGDLASQQNIKYFSHYFVYAYDLEKKYSPIALHEWKDQGSWPGFHYTVRGRSLFAAPEDAQLIEEWKSKRKISGKEMKERCARWKEIFAIDSDFDIDDNNAPIYAHVERSIHSSDEEDVDNMTKQSTSALSSPVTVKTDSPVKTVTTPLKENSHTPIETKLSLFVDHLQETIMASGVPVNSSVATNNLSTNAQTIVNDTIALNPFLKKNKDLKRRMVDALEPSKRQHIPDASLRKKSVTNQARRAIDVRNLRGLDKCENCKMHFSDFQKHCNTRRHREYATNDKNFEQIDGFIKSLHGD